MVVALQVLVLPTDDHQPVLQSARLYITVRFKYIFTTRFFDGVTEDLPGLDRPVVAVARQSST
jgi:hypothetical protein